MDRTAELVKEWMHKAEHDLGMAQLALENRPEYADAICFHCQQATEKYLKSYLVFLGIRFERKHDLDYLLDLIADKAPVGDAWYELAERLDGYAVEVRYPDDWQEIPPEEVKAAYQTALTIKSMILDRILKAD